MKVDLLNLALGVKINVRKTALILGLTGFVSSTGFSWTSWVGVLEDWPLNHSSTKEESKEVNYEARVRPLFIRVDQNQWVPAPRPGEPNPVVALPKAFSWDVCFSGRGEGHLTAMLTADGIPTTTPPYTLRPEERAPWRTKRSADYAGWLPTPVYKPILLTSSLNSSCSDPEKWRQSSAEKVKSKMGEISKTLLSEMNTGRLTTDKYEFLEKDLKVFRAWSSPKHGHFVAIKPRPKQNATEFFQITSDQSVLYLGKDMMLVDAGDFDGDGSTEIVFKRRGDKKDIYELHSKGKRVAESIWDYP